jgi:hypothetical protein
MAGYVGVWRGEADQARLLREMISNLPYAWTTVWGRFGYGQAPLTAGLYRAGDWLLALAAVGFFPFALRRSGQPRDAGMWLLLALAVVAVLAAWGALMSTIPATANARMIFAAYPALGLFVSAGFAGWGWLAARLLPARAAPVMAAAVGLMITAMLAIAAAAWATVLLPAFARPRALTGAEVEAASGPASMSVGGMAEIIGYHVSPAEVLPGEPAYLTVYWEVLAPTSRPLTVFVHLIDAEGIPIAVRHTYPGLGNYPTTWWEPGLVFADTYRVDIPETAYAPDHGEWRVGLFDRETGERMGVFQTSTGVPTGDSVPAGSLTVQAHPGPAPNAVRLNFGGRVELAGYELDRRTVAPGESLQVTAYWQALAPDSDYWAFAHAVGVDGSIWAISDSVILPPATGWPDDQLVVETRQLQLAADTPPGLYDIYFGVTRVDETGQSRLPLLAADGHELDDKVVLTKIRVVEN